MNALRTAVRTTGELLITTGVVVLLFVAWQLWWTDVSAGRAQAAITQQLTQEWGPPPPAPVAPPPDAVPVDVPFEELPQLRPPAPGEAFGIVRIPRFGSDYAVPLVEGTGTEELKDGIGHYRGTAMPGDVGNVAVAGHRTTYGKPLNQVEELVAGDAVVLETAGHYYTYRMVSTAVVRPEQVEVIDPVPGQPGAVPTERLLTLTTCHPMYSARERFVVHAALESVTPRSAGPPPSLLLAAPAAVGG